MLHPLDRLVGAPVEIGHGDGSRTKSRFPELIRSDPLWTSIRSMSYEPVPGLRLHCAMEGDLWECEDQRNWGDASFKTYSRPTSLPSPYLLLAGVRMEQVVTLSLCSAPERPHRARQPAVSIAVGGDTSARMPQIGISACPADAIFLPCRNYRRPWRPVGELPPRSSSVGDRWPAEELPGALGQAEFEGAAGDYPVGGGRPS